MEGGGHVALIQHCLNNSNNEEEGEKQGKEIESMQTSCDVAQIQGSIKASTCFLLFSPFRVSDAVTV